MTMTLAHRPNRPEESDDPGRGRQRGGIFVATTRRSNNNTDRKRENNDDASNKNDNDDDDNKEEEKRHLSFRHRVIWTVSVMTLLSISAVTYLCLTVIDPIQTLKASLRGGALLDETTGIIILDVVATTHPHDFSVVPHGGGDGREGGRTAGTAGTATTATTVPPDDHPYPFLVGDGRFVPMPHLEGCAVSFTPPPLPRTHEADWRLPLWVPSYPSSVGSNPTKQGDLVKAMVGLLTGLSDHKPVKNYHMSIRKKLKRCRGVSETVACTNGHPLVDIKAATQTEMFQPHVIIPIRNFATAFPASLVDKSIAYHGASGQGTPAEWRAIRDEHLQSAFTSWKELILWWKHADYYNITLYLPFEDVFRRENGPKLVGQLSNVLQQRGGFESATSQHDFECIWYKVYKDEWHRQQTLMTYIPTYTKQQQEWMIVEMKKFQSSEQVVSDEDPILVALLERYIGQIANSTPLDK